MITKHVDSESLKRSIELGILREKNIKIGLELGKAMERIQQLEDEVSLAKDHVSAVDEENHYLRRFINKNAGDKTAFKPSLIALNRVHGKHLKR